jgi:rubrerythrin
MSIIGTLDRLFESPAAIVAREREKVAARRREEDGGEADPPTFVCRLCGYEWQHRGYCPICLAETMQPAPGCDRG